VRDQRGFTLVEVLVAFLILMLVVTMSLAAFLERNRRIRQAREIILAYQALANEAEYRRRMPYPGLETQPDTFISDTSVLSPLSPFTTHVEVELESPGVKNVTMIVRWNEPAREARLSLVRADTGGSAFW
jgi:type II secretory pathway pseudopilin PulG